MSYEIAAVKYGTVTSRKSVLFHDYDAYGEPDADAELAFYFWVLRRGDDTVLLDTGFKPGAAAKRGRTCLCEPVSALEQLGVDRDSVSAVIISHFHYDHIGNVDAFPNAKIVAPRDEFAYWIENGPPDAAVAHHVEVDELAVLAEARHEGRLSLTSGTEEILDGITAISVGGHSPGQQVTVVDGTHGPVVLASDAVHFYEELELSRPFSAIYDLPAMHAAYELCRSLVADRGASLVPGHDPATLHRFPAESRSTAGLAVTLT
jgi:glyoxylase-like metal-dependent hydrolase (beta-lactamase superfamily II)